MSITVTEPAAVQDEAETRPGPAGQPETRAQRRDRLLADTSLVTMRAIAKMVGLGDQRVRELRMFAQGARDVLADPLASDAARAEAREYLVEALPEPVPDPEHLHNGPHWPACVIWQWGRTSQRLDGWYEPQRKDSPGRRPGAGVVHRKVRLSFGQQLERLAHVEVDDATVERLRGPLLGAYAAARADGQRVGQARDSAVATVATDTGSPADVVRKALLLVITSGAGARG